MTPDEAAVARGVALAALYRDIGGRTMRDLPIYNAALEVQDVGFRAVDGLALGILVTPWFMNVVLTTFEGGASLAPARVGTLRAVPMPAGTIDVIVGTLDGFGRLDTASLYSPMSAFDDPAATRLAAEAAIAALLDPSLAAAATPSPDAMGEPALTTAPPATPDRRRFLLGRAAVAGHEATP